MVKIGDVFEVVLSDNRITYGQYVFLDEKFGPLIQVYDLVDKKLEIDNLYKAKLFFPPIIAGVNAAVRTGIWKVVGRKKVEKFVYPGFVSTFWDEKTGKAGSWSYWDGKKNNELGCRLPEEYKRYEYLIVWDIQSILNRIEKGIYPFPYKELILFNEFTPKKSEL